MHWISGATIRKISGHSKNCGGCIMYQSSSCSSNTERDTTDSVACFSWSYLTVGNGNKTLNASKALWVLQSNKALMWERESNS